MPHTVRQEIMPDVFLNTYKTDRFCTSLIGIQFLWPLSAESAAPLAILPSLLRRGCEQYPDMEQMGKALDHLYGARIEPYIRKKGEILAAGFVCDVIDGEMTAENTPLTESLIRLACSLFTRPLIKDGGFYPAYLSGEKQALKDKIASRINDKRVYAQKRLLEIMCAGEAFAYDELGTPETVDALTETGLYAFLETLLRKGRIELFICGRTFHERAADCFRDCLSALTREKAPPVGTDKGPQPGAPRETAEVMDVTQGKLVMGFRTHTTAADPSYPALMLANALFGGTPQSKLFMNVRERLSLCYYASSFLDPCKAVAFVSSGINVNDYEKARDEILRQLEEVKAGRFTDLEWESAKAALLAALGGMKDSPTRLEDFTLTQIAADSGLGLDTLLARLTEVTPAQAAEAAKKFALDTIYFLRSGEGAL